MKTLADRLYNIIYKKPNKDLTDKQVSDIKEIAKKLILPYTYIQKEDAYNKLAELSQEDLHDWNNASRLYNDFAERHNFVVEKLEVLEGVYNNIIRFLEHWLEGRVTVKHFNNTFLSELHEINHICTGWNELLDFSQLELLLENNIVKSRAEMGFFSFQLISQLELLVESLITALYGDLPLHESLNIAEEEYSIKISTAHYQIAIFTPGQFNTVYGD